MRRFPDDAHLPATQRTGGIGYLRYEDVTQDGRVALLALPHTIGLTVWRGLLADHPVLKAVARERIVPVFTRLVIEGGGGPVSVRKLLDLQGAYQLAHTTNGAGEVDRLMLNTWTTIRAPLARTNGPPPEGAGTPIVAGRVFGENVFTRPFAPAGQRRVLRFEGQAEPVPPDRYAWLPPEELLALPADAELLDPEPVPDATPIVFGLAHTDANQHVNSLVYPRVFEDAALRRLAAHGVPPLVLARYVEITYRKPFFAGERAEIRVQVFVHRDGHGAVGYFFPAGGARPSVYVRMLFER